MWNLFFIDWGVFIVFFFLIDFNFKVFIVEVVFVCFGGIYVFDFCKYLFVSFLLLLLLDLDDF